MIIKAAISFVMILRLVECERSEEHTSELQSQSNLVCRLLLEKKKKRTHLYTREKSAPQQLQFPLLDTRNLIFRDPRGEPVEYPGRTSFTPHHLVPVQVIENIA